MGALSGSREPSQASCLGPAGFDPERLEEIANRCVFAAPGDEESLLWEAHDASRPDKHSIEIWTDERREEWTPEYEAFNAAGWKFNNLMEEGAYLEAALTLVDKRALWAVGDMEDGPFARLCWPQPNGGFSGGYFEAFAATVPLALCCACARALAIEARRAATGNTDAVHESAGPKDNAQGQPATQGS